MAPSWSIFQLVIFPHPFPSPFFQQASSPHPAQLAAFSAIFSLEKPSLDPVENIVGAVVVDIPAPHLPNPLPSPFFQQASSPHPAQLTHSLLCSPWKGNHQTSLKAPLALSQSTVKLRISPHSPFLAFFSVLMESYSSTASHIFPYTFLSKAIIRPSIEQHQRRYAQSRSPVSPISL